MAEFLLAVVLLIWGAAAFLLLRSFWKHWREWIGGTLLFAFAPLALPFHFVARSVVGIRRRSCRNPIHAIRPGEFAISETHLHFGDTDIALDSVQRIDSILLYVGMFADAPSADFLIRVYDGSRRPWGCILGTDWEHEHELLAKRIPVARHWASPTPVFAALSIPVLLVVLLLALK
ncbi:MAG: hypothetical protein AAGE52_37990 [Myxococcota bacterium]